MERVIVGMSGGVDSSVAALLLKQRGYDVIGMTVLTCENAEEPWELEETAAAAEVAGQLGIPHITEDMRKPFGLKVREHFVDEYFAGRTPNPCIICNREVKWQAMLRAADRLDAGYVATGHYASVRKMSNGRYAAALSADPAKDQSYVLFMLSQEALSRTILPTGEFTKPEIRRIAEEAGLASAKSPDSQDICFVSGNDYAGFLEKAAPDRMPGEGDYISKITGDIIGRHRGYVHYTIGQRKGLGIAAGHHVYVSEIRPETNEVVISDEDVFMKMLSCSGLNFMGSDPMEFRVGDELRASARVRYAHRGAACTVKRTAGDRLESVFDEPVRAVTPGQAVVFYDDEGAVLFGGWIDEGYERR